MACLYFVPFLESHARESEKTHSTGSATKSSSKTGVFTTCRASGSGGLAANWLLQESHASSSTTSLLLFAILVLLLFAILSKRVKNACLELSSPEHLGRRSRRSPRRLTLSRRPRRRRPRRLARGPFSLSGRNRGSLFFVTIAALGFSCSVLPRRRVRRVLMSCWSGCDEAFGREPQLGEQWELGDWR